MLSLPSSLETSLNISGVSPSGGVTGTTLESVSGPSFKFNVALLGIVPSTNVLKSAPSLILATITMLIVFPAKSSNPSVIVKLTSCSLD